jgi:hypothetical protein
VPLGTTGAQSTQTSTRCQGVGSNRWVVGVGLTFFSFRFFCRTFGRNPPRSSLFKADDRPQACLEVLRLHHGPPPT